MATVTAARAASGFPAYMPRANGDCGVAYGTYEITSALSKNDIVEFFKVPAGVDIIDGMLFADDLDTGTEALEIDVGDSASTARFLNSGVLSGDVVANHVIAAQIKVHFLTTALPHNYTAATTVIGTIVAAAASGGTGTLGCYALYTAASASD